MNGSEKRYSATVKERTGGEGIHSSATDMPLCEIKVDKEGTWYYKGFEIIQKGIVALFYEHLEQDDQGRYVIHWQGRTCYLEVEDTPFVVWKTRLVGEEDHTHGVLLSLSDGTEEPMNPRSLYIGPQNVPYCRVHGGKFLARFSRKAYYQLARIVREDHRMGSFYVKIGSKRFYIQSEREGP